MEKEKKFPIMIIYLTWITQNIAWLVASIFFKLFFKVQVVGLENLSNIKDGIIIASNHVSELDSVLIRTSVPLRLNTFPFFAVSRFCHEYGWKGWRKFVYRDWFFRALGAYPVPKGIRDYENALGTFIKLAKRKQTTIIFIGGRQKTINEPIKNKAGTAYLSWATGLPVIPATVCGTYGLTIKKIFFKRSEIIIKFGKPLTREILFPDIQNEPSYEELREVSKLVVNQIEKELRY